MTTSEDHYFASAAPDDLDRERMSCLEAVLDPVTTARLERIGVAPGWSCLEVAAGGGSIAAWLARRVGPSGSVLATDMNTRFLGHLTSPVEVRTLNLLTDDIPPATFDLVHGRMILMHLSDPEVVLAKLAQAVKPGGWLCVEEGDYGTCTAVDLSAPDARAWTEAWRALTEKLTAAGVVDSYFGRRLRGAFEELGFEQVGSDGVTGARRGGEPGARFWQLSFAAARDGGLVTEEEYDRTVRLMNDPTFVFTDSILYGAWGRAPS